MSKTPVTHQDLIAEVVRLRSDVETLTTCLRLSSVVTTTSLDFRDEKNRAAGPAVTTDADNLPARVGFGRDGEIREFHTKASVDFDGSVSIDLGENFAVVPIDNCDSSDDVSYDGTFDDEDDGGPVALRPVV